ncbi:hypothetical protein B0H19DRAFT_1373300 [Mycena capillaripes]|nr:hypothetical protein B0H19DRAFT_1373300 [Mycena capillaripes]
MTAQTKLTTIPADIQHHLLSILPDFYDLGALILTHRCFHDIYKARRASLLDDVARNLLGYLFDEGVLLARAQEAAYGLGDASVKGFSSNTVLLIVNNNYIANSLEIVVFGLLKANREKFDIYDEESLVRFADQPFTVEASPTESIRFQAAVHRFWRFVLQSKKMRTPFLKRLASSELLELNHFVTGISNLIYAMRGQPQCSDWDWDFVSSVLSTGPENILQLWDALQNNDPVFLLEFESAGTNGEEGFFSYPFMDAMESKKLDDIRGIGSLEPIFDGNNEKMHEILEEIEKGAGEDVSS